MKHLVLLHRALLFLSLCLIPLSGFARNDDVTLYGYVVDSPMNTPINNASVTVLNAADSSYVTVAMSDLGSGTVTGDEKVDYTYTGGFRVRLPRGKYILSVSCLGYEPTVVNVDLTTLGKRVYDYTLPYKITLTRESKKLKEVVVTASKVKFYHKGDTLVFNADAFHLAEGSMLDALIQQMPGVELKDNGEIYVNGKYVDELLLNGKHFFNDNRQLMLQNLGAYTVKDIQVYDKRDRLSELAGAQIGKGSYVMDVKMKKEFMGGTVINAEAGYGSEDRYLGRLFAMLFTPTGQYSLYFNANNLNESRRPGQQTSWSPDKMPTGVRRSMGGGFDYSVKTLDDHWEVNGNVNAETTRETDGTDVVRNNYLVSGNTYDYEFNRSRNKTWTIGTNHKIYYKTKGGYGIAMEPFFTYTDWNNWGGNVSATFGESFNDVTTDFIRNIYSGDNAGALSSLINRNIEENRMMGHSLSTGTNLWQGFRLPGTNDMLVLNLVGEYNNRRDERFNHYDINFGQDPAPAQSANRYFKNFPDFDSDLSAELSYSRRLGSSAYLTLSYKFNHSYHKATSDLYSLGALDDVDDFMLGKLPSAIDYELSLDRNNSYLSRMTENNHKLSLSYNYWAPERLWIQLRIPVTFMDRKLDYQRAAVDTTVRRRPVLFEIGESFIQYWFDKKNNIFWKIGLQSRTPDLVSMVDITDDTNPLYIMRGNGGLKNALIFSTLFSYLHNYNDKESWYIDVNYEVVSNALSQGYTYDTRTGVKEGRYYNVNGNWKIDGTLSYYKQIGGLTLNNWLTAGHSTSVDLVGQDSPQLFRSKVYNLNFSYRLLVKYKFGKHSVGLSFKPLHERFTSNMSDFVKQNTWTVQSGIDATFELPCNFQLSTDFSVYNRCGYTDEALNTDNFVWNARLTYRALKGKLLLMLDGYDILHDLSNVSYTMNAQARTEIYRTVLPRYFMFHVQWRFNSNPKGHK